MTAPSLSMIDRARRDPGVFAELLVGQPLWPHQLEAALSPARFRIATAGRQVGKSRLLGVLALHQAFAVAGSLTLIVSAGEVAARRLLDECASLAQSPLLAGAVVDEGASLLTLSNGSTVRSVPASSRQIRGWAVDLLIVDEAAFIAPEIWQSAEPSIVARKDSRVILTSSPWGDATHFFRVLWNRGMSAPDSMYESWHWPSSVSPLVDDELLEHIRDEWTESAFAREFLAEWTESAGSYFTPSELDDAVVDAPLVPPGEVVGVVPAVAGVDWAFSRDASTLCVITAAERATVRGTERPRYRVAWLLEEFRRPYSEFIDDVVASVSGIRGSGYSARSIVSECNGVGQYPTQELLTRLTAGGAFVHVVAMHTTSSRKEDWFGFVKGLLQQGRLELPRHPGLLRQLAALEFEQAEAGGTRIAVPERAGHDDLAMALALAASALVGDDFGVGAVAPVSRVLVRARLPLLPVVDFSSVEW